MHFIIYLALKADYTSVRRTCLVTSAKARFSRARPMTAFSHANPPTRIAPTIAVMIPKGAIAKIIWSSHVNDSLKNCCAKFSPNNARSCYSLKKEFVGRWPESCNFDWSNCLTALQRVLLIS